MNVLLALLWNSCRVYNPSANIPKVLPARAHDTLPSYDVSKFDRSLFTIYEIAHIVTGAPIDAIKGIHYAESRFASGKVNHKDPLDKGPFGLRSTYQLERMQKWGKFDPNNDVEAAVITGYIYMDSLRRLGNADLAIAAHNQGVNGVRKHGPNLRYIATVKRGARA